MSRGLFWKRDVGDDFTISENLLKAISCMTTMNGSYYVSMLLQYSMCKNQGLIHSTEEEGLQNVT